MNQMMADSARERLQQEQETDQSMAAQLEGAIAHAATDTSIDINTQHSTTSPTPQTHIDNTGATDNSQTSTADDNSIMNAPSVTLSGSSTRTSDATAGAEQGAAAAGELEGATGGISPSNRSSKPTTKAEKDKKNLQKKSGKDIIGT